jgi:hypothetical protein
MSTQMDKENIDQPEISIETQGRKRNCKVWGKISAILV